MSMTPIDRDSPLSADAVDRIREEVVARTVSQKHAQQRSGGTVLARRPTYFDPVVRRGARRVCPFDITIELDELLDELVATFRPGTINQLLPDNYLTGVVVPDTGTKYLVLNCTASSGQITGATFTAEDDPPDALEPFAGEPPTAFELLIGVVVDGVAVKVWGCGNIQALPVEAFRLQKITPVAGQVPYDVYYTWEFSLL
jgi:hypothetical protein